MIEEKIKQQRDFVIGDEWLYFKIYLGEHFSELFLVQYITPLIKDLLQNKIINSWFFIRYTDPHFHLRIRFYCKKKENIYIVINKLNPIFKNLIHNHMIWKVNSDTYTREIERYGLDLINHAEDLFFNDSMMVLRMLAENEYDKEIRMFLGILLIDFYLDFFEIREKRDFMEKFCMGINANYGKEIPNLQKKINEQFKIQKQNIENLFLKSDRFSHVHELISNYFISVLPIIKNILKEKNKYNLNSFLNSIIHMSMNRIFKEKVNFHEMITYNLLLKYYTMQYFKKLSK